MVVTCRGGWKLQMCLLRLCVSSVMHPPYGPVIHPPPNRLGLFQFAQRRQGGTPMWGDITRVTLVFLLRTKGKASLILGRYNYPHDKMTRVASAYVLSASPQMSFGVH